MKKTKSIAVAPLLGHPLCGHIPRAERAAQAVATGVPEAGGYAPRAFFNPMKGIPAMTTKAIRLALCAAALGAATAFADTDVYGNEIRRDAGGAVTYRFWYGEETAEAMSPANSSSSPSASASFATGTLSARTAETSLEARFRTWLASDGTSLLSTMLNIGFILIIR